MANEYRIDRFIDDVLAPLCRAKRVRFNFSKSISNDFSFRAVPVNPNVTHAYYDFALTQPSTFTHLLASAYYLISYPQESVPPVRILDVPEIVAANPFMVQYDPDRDNYTVFNHYFPNSQRNVFASFSQVMAHISRKWYFINVERSELLTLAPYEVWSRKSDEELLSIVTHPMYTFVRALAEREIAEFGPGVVADLRNEAGILNLILAVRSREDGVTRANSVYREFGHSLGEGLSQEFFRQVVTTFV
jgi:hypothetical protein